jgi:uncharacterized RDD family membrane protein YckC
MASQPDHRSGIVDAAGRAAFFPAKAAAQMWRGQIEGAVDAALQSPETARAIDRALAGPLPEQIARSAVEHHVLERLVAELARTGELERLLTNALGSSRTRVLADRLIASDEMGHVLGAVVGSPEVRGALARQTTGLADDVLDGLRTRARGLDDRADRRRAPAGETPYGGIATRALALAADVAVAAAIYASVVGLASLIGLLVGGLRPEWLVGILLASGWSLVAGAYFVLFWSTAGRTPGMQLMRVRVRTAGDGGTPTAARCIVRVIGLVISIVPMFAGFLPVLFDRRRRGLADMLAGTVVVNDEE